MSAHRRGRWHYSATLLAAVSVACHAVAQDAATPDVNQPGTTTRQSPPDADPIQVPSGGRPLIRSRLDSIPHQLKAAIARTNCNVPQKLLTAHPVLIFRPSDGRRVMAVVPCLSLTLDSRAFLFESSVEQEPTPMMFPVLEPTGGISASSQPGLMTWDAQTATLTAWRGSSVCPAREMRHTYRQGGGELNGFALSKIEHRQLRCIAPETYWQTLWQSPIWNLQP